MVEYAKPLTDEQAAQYSKIIEEIRNGELGQELKKLREERKAVLDDHEKNGGFDRKKSELINGNESEILKKMFKEFEKKAKNIEGFYQTRSNKIKPSILDRLQNRDPNKYVANYVEAAFWKELDQPGAFKNEYERHAEWHNKSNGFAPEEKSDNTTAKEEVIEVETKPQTQTQSKTNDLEVQTQTQSHETQNTEQQPQQTDLHGKTQETPQPTSTMDTDKSAEWLDKYQSLMDKQPFNAEELWQYSEDGIKNGYVDDNYRSGTATWIANNDPSYQPVAMLRYIREGALGGEFEDGDDKEAAFSMHEHAILGVANIVKHNKNNADVMRSAVGVLHTLSDNIMSVDATGYFENHERSKLACAMAIVQAHGEMTYFSDGPRKQALEDIGKCAECMDTGIFRGKYTDNRVLDSVNHVLDGDSSHNKETAAAAYNVLKGKLPRNEEDAKKMLTALETIGKSGDRNLQAAMVDDVQRIFKEFDNSEEIQRKCYDIIKPYGDKGVNKAKVRGDSFKKTIDYKTAAGKSGRPGGYDKPNAGQQKNTTQNKQVERYSKEWVAQQKAIEDNLHIK